MATRKTSSFNSAMSRFNASRNAEAERAKKAQAAAEKAAKEAAAKAASGKTQDPAKAAVVKPAKQADPFKDPDRTKGGTDPKLDGDGGKKLKGPGVDLTATQKNEDRDVAHQQAIEMQQASQAHAKEMQQNAQNFQREEAARADERWYAHQNYLRAMKQRNVKWSFKSISSGGTTRSRWRIEANPQNGGAQPPNGGRIGVTPRGPDGKSQLRMNGPAIQPSTPIGSEATRDLRGGSFTPQDPGTSANTSGRSAGFNSFKYENRPETVAQSVARQNTKEDLPWLGTKDANGVSFEQKFNMIAEATATGARASIAHQAVDAAGKPVGSPTAVSGDGGGQFASFSQGSSAPTVGNTVADALANAEQAQGLKKGALGSTSSRVAEVDRAMHQQSLAKAGVTREFKLSDFQERKQGRDGKYYDA